ncbi:ATP-dependent zinc metalloprotease FtsH [Geomonas sp. RF6]|uniref:ATP-dependent zinc metalloprotease FtsH n=1 Tax=Geomonas sp. RF6 TaxID=2897342 RepID=UPI001E4DBDF8|nr:ATP-dependent zinc metalloprotease FtsH [Geomonas sp. RF6]UFS70760.1 ATP-dependent zinc metalloprotease FtsH [Geomonas sp. RF6]
MTRTRLIQLCFAVAIIGLIASGYLYKEQRAEERSRISYTAFVDLVNVGAILSVKAEGDAITAEGKGGATYRVYRPLDADISKLLISKHIDYSAKPPAQQRWFEIGFLLLVIGCAAWALKKFSVFGRSKATLVESAKTNTAFSDVAGAEEAKADLSETVEFLKDPEKFNRLGGKMPTGILLVGPPGTGKTLLARAVAGEAGVPFFSMSGSEFVEMFVGVGASRVRDLFAQGRKSAPCIVFIDEIDAVGRKRDAGGGGASDERDQTLNQLLVEMDGFTVNSGIVVIAATNRPEVLDPALLRSGRFDRQVVVGSPDIKGREEILKVHVKDVPLSSEVDLRVLARGTSGMSGADLANVVNEAAILAARANKDSVEMSDFEAAKDKVMMGAEKKSMVLSEKSKLSTAYHEAGHVLVAKLVPACDPVHKVSIIPRGRALGVTLQIPEEDKHCYTRDMLIGHIKVLMGGRAAEELIYKTTTTGAGNDLARATDLARNMVCEYGMSEAFGPVAFGNHEGTATKGHEVNHGRNFSETTALEIDREIRSIVTGCYNEVMHLLKKNRAALENLTMELVAKETLEGDEIDEAIEEHITVEAA